MDLGPVIPIRHGTFYSQNGQTCIVRARRGASLLGYYKNGSEHCQHCFEQPTTSVSVDWHFRVRYWPSFRTISLLSRKFGRSHSKREVFLPRRHLTLIAMWLRTALVPTVFWYRLTSVHLSPHIVTSHLYNASCVVSSGPP